MTLYTLTYEFEPGGGNIQYKTRQQAQKEAATHDIELEPVTTGLALTDETINGIAIADLHDDVVPEDIFESATAIQRTARDTDSEGDDGRQATREQAAASQSIEEPSFFEESDDMAALLMEVNQTPGRGVLFNTDLTLCHPFDHDLWFVTMQSETIDATPGLTTTDVVEFQRDNRELLEDDLSLRIGVFHGVTDPTIQLSLVAALADPAEAGQLASRADSREPMNFYRFELSKAPLVVGESTHGPGQVEAVFRNVAGDEVCSRDLAYRRWHEDLNVSFHPLGVIIDRDLYRPVVAAGADVEAAAVGDPLRIATYRGSKTSRPWQFGITRHDGQILLTQARAAPPKFDPVLKRFPIETQLLGDEPLVFSHTVSRRVWSEDPVNLHVQSQRSEGLRTQFLYGDSEGWHLIQPEALGEPADEAESSFEPTQLDGVAVRSSKISAETDGESKATVEHEYRISPSVSDACDCLYALSYYEANEESVGTVEWEIADATAYEIIRGRTA